MQKSLSVRNLFCTTAAVCLTASSLSVITAVAAQEPAVATRPFPGPGGRLSQQPPTPRGQQATPQNFHQPQPAVANLPAATPANTATLPATAPTTLPAATPAQPVATTPKLPEHRAIVTFQGGLLNVKADNSSLNQILRSISRTTGMAITGGVADQRVFGNYGPAEPSTILATLLDGTGTNMILREGTNAPVELILTQRTGGPSPPNPNNQGTDDARDEEPPPPPPPPARPFTATQQAAQPQPAAQPTGPQPIAQPLNNPLGNPSNTSPTAATLPTANSVPLDSINTPSTVTAPAQGIVDAPNPPAPGSTTDPAANGTKTADDVYQQLLKLQQQQQKPATPTPTTTTPQ